MVRESMIDVAQAEGESGSNGWFGIGKVRRWRWNIACLYRKLDERSRGCLLRLEFA